MTWSGAEGPSLPSGHIGQLSQAEPRKLDIVGPANLDKLTQLTSQLAGKKTSTFKYHDKGTLATIGRNSAVAQIKGLPRLTGFIAWVIWIAVHVFSLLGNRNRLATMLNLSARYLFWQRSHNAIVGETPTSLLDHPSTSTKEGSEDGSATTRESR